MERYTIDDIPGDQPATMIDLEGRPPVIGVIYECVKHYSIYKPHARQNARILLTKPVFREGRPTRTWILEPDEIGSLADRLLAD